MEINITAPDANTGALDFNITASVVNIEALDSNITRPNVNTGAPDFNITAFYINTCRSAIRFPKIAKPVLYITTSPQNRLTFTCPL